MTRGKPQRVTEEPLRHFWQPPLPDQRIVREPVREPEREPVREPEREPVREPVRG